MKASFTKLISLIFFSLQVHAFSDPGEIARPDIQSNSNFIEIKSGTFPMGSPENELDRFYDEQLHQVTLTKAFEMQKTPVTQEQYFLLVGKNPSTFNKKEHCSEYYKEIKGVSLCATSPVERVSWDDVQKFLKVLNAKDDHFYYRLPTEAEWEYSARAGTTTAYWFGNSVENLAEHSWYGRNSLGQSHAVGLKTANGFGLYDMYGNVWQWTNDWYGQYPLEGQQDPTGFEGGVTKVLRGGSSFSSAADLRSAARTRLPPQAWGFDIGFRLVRIKK